MRLLIGTFHATTPHSREHGSVPLSSHNGSHYSHSGYPRDISERFMDLQVHLFERFLKQLYLPRSTIAPSPLGGASSLAGRQSFAGGVQLPLEQTVAVELLNPLAIKHVSLAAGHVLHRLRVDQDHLETGFLKDLVRRYPVDAR